MDDTVLDEQPLRSPTALSPKEKVEKKLRDLKKEPKKFGTCCTVFSFLFSLILLPIGLVLILILAGGQLYFVNKDNQASITQPSCSFKRTVFLNRGNISYAQENTYESVVEGIGNVSAVVAGGATWRVGAQFDVRSAKNDYFVLHHDANAKRMTGVDKLVADATLDDLRNWTIQSTIDGYAYPRNLTQALVWFVVKDVCLKNNATPMAITAKDIRSGIFTMKAFERTACNETVKTVVYTADDPLVALVLRQAQFKLNLDNRIAMTYMPGKLPLGEKFWIKNGLLNAATGADVFHVHKLLWKAMKPELLEWKKRGYCLGVFGVSEDEVDQYTEASIVVADAMRGFNTPLGVPGGDGWEEAITIKSDLTAYYGAVALCITVLLLWLFLAIRVTRHCCQGCCGRRKQPVKPVRSPKSPAGQAAVDVEAPEWSHAMVA